MSYQLGDSVVPLIKHFPRTSFYSGSTDWYKCLTINLPPKHHFMRGTIMLYREGVYVEGVKQNFYALAVDIRHNEICDFGGGSKKIESVNIHSIAGAVRELFEESCCLYDFRNDINSIVRSSVCYFNRSEVKVFVRDPCPSMEFGTLKYAFQKNFAALALNKEAPISYNENSYMLWFSETELKMMTRGFTLRMNDEDLQIFTQFQHSSNEYREIEKVKGSKHGNPQINWTTQKKDPFILPLGIDLSKKLKELGAASPPLKLTNSTSPTNTIMSQHYPKVEDNLYMRITQTNLHVSEGASKQPHVISTQLSNVNETPNQVDMVMVNGVPVARSILPPGLFDHLPSIKTTQGMNIVQGLPPLYPTSLPVASPVSFPTGSPPPRESPKIIEGLPVVSTFKNGSQKSTPLSNHSSSSVAGSNKKPLPQGSTRKSSDGMSPPVISLPSTKKESSQQPTRILPLPGFDMTYADKIRNAELPNIGSLTIVPQVKTKSHPKSIQVPVVAPVQNRSITYPPPTPIGFNFDTRTISQIFTAGPIPIPSIPQMPPIRYTQVEVPTSQTKSVQSPDGKYLRKIQNGFRIRRQSPEFDAGVFLPREYPRLWEKLAIFFSTIYANSGELV